MADSVLKTRAIALASLGVNAVTKITDPLENRATSKFANLLGYEQFAKYSVPQTADTITAIEFGSTTKITINSAHYRYSGSYVYISGIINDGLWRLNGRHKITYVEGSSATQFTIPIDSSNYESVAYTSGGEVVDGIWSELLDAEAYLLLWYLIPACIDIKDGDFGVINQTKEWGEGSATNGYMDEIEKVAQNFYDKALEIIMKNKGDGDSSNEGLIIASS